MRLIAFNDSATGTPTTRTFSLLTGQRLLVYRTGKRNYLFNHRIVNLLPINCMIIMQQFNWSNVKLSAMY